MTAVASSPVSQRRLPFGARLLIGSIVGIVVYFGILLFFQYISNLGSPDPVAVQNAFPRAVATSAQQVGNALVLGAIYALIALGYTMVYGIIELINFAHGDVFMVGTFIGLFFLTTSRPRSTSSGCTCPTARSRSRSSSARSSSRRWPSA